MTSAVPSRASSPASATTRALSEPGSVFLDAVRGGAAQVVVIGHALGMSGVDPSGLWARPYMQNIAVVAFFAMSGFVIAYSALRKRAQGGYGLSDYLIDRTSRLYTAFLPALVFVAIVDVWRVKMGAFPYGHAAALNLRMFVGNMAMMQDYPYQVFAPLGINVPQFTSFASARPFWTVAIEWWIYLGFGWLIFRARRLTVWSLLMGTLLLVVPSYNFFGGRGNGLALVWMAGALAAAAFLSRADERIDGRLIWMLAIYVTGSSFVYVYVVTAEAYSLPFGIGLVLTIFLVVVGLERVASPVPRALRVIVPFVASYSYSLYLVHYTVIETLQPYFRPHGGLVFRVTVLFLASNVVAWAFYMLTERHYIVVRNRVKASTIVVRERFGWV